jgi:hypothetical protein
MTTRSPTEPPRARAVAEARIDEALAASMDASDPPAYGGITWVGTPADDEACARRRAFDLWRGAGRPDGRDLEFWLRAEREVRRSGS